MLRLRSVLESNGKVEPSILAVLYVLALAVTAACCLQAPPGAGVTLVTEAPGVTTVGTEASTSGAPARATESSTQTKPRPSEQPIRVETTTIRAPARRPCHCDDGQCGCCTGALLQNFVNFAPRQRGCLNITYDPDDFAFGMALSFNDRVLYKNAISAKNPRPLCVPIPRIASAKLCVKLSNVYFVGRNLHACIDMEAKWQNSQALQMSFDCIRIGADGVKVVKPEDGAGLPLGVPVGVTPSPDEYDEIPDEHPPDTSASATATIQTSTPAGADGWHEEGDTEDGSKGGGK